MKKRKFWKKFVACFCVISSLFVINFAIFSVNVSANGTNGLSDIYTIGAPFTLEYTSLTTFGGNGSDFSGSIPSINVYSADYDGTPSSYRWAGNLVNTSTGVSDSLYRFRYLDNPVSGSNFELNFLSDRRSLISFHLDSPVVFSSSNDLYSYYSFGILLSQLVSLSGSSASTGVVTYSYSFAELDPDSGVVGTYRRSVQQTISLGSSYYFRIFNTTFIDSILGDVDSFVNPSDGRSYFVLLDSTVSFAGFAVGQLSFDEGSTSPRLYSSYRDFVSDRFAGVLYNESITHSTSFEGISWTGWLVNAVGGFLDFQIVPGLSFAGMLGLLVGMSLFIVFLKVFSGG